MSPTSYQTALPRNQDRNHHLLGRRCQVGPHTGRPQSSPVRRGTDRRVQRLISHGTRRARHGPHSRIDGNSSNSGTLAFQMNQNWCKMEPRNRLREFGTRAGFGCADPDRVGTPVVNADRAQGVTMLTSSNQSAPATQGRFRYHDQRRSAGVRAPLGSSGEPRGEFSVRPLRPVRSAIHRCD